MIDEGGTSDEDLVVVLNGNGVCRVELTIKIQRRDAARESGIQCEIRIQSPHCEIRLAAEPHGADNDNLTVRRECDCCRVRTRLCDVDNDAAIFNRAESWTATSLR